MSDHKRALVPLESWSYSAPELRTKSRTIDIGLFAESLIYYDKVTVNPSNQLQFAEFLGWFIAQESWDELIRLLQENVISIYDYAFASAAVNTGGNSFGLLNIQDPLQAQPNSFEERYLFHPSVKKIVPNKLDHDSLTSALCGKVIEIKASNYGSSIRNAELDFQDPRRNALIVQAFVDEIYRQKNMGRPPEVEAEIVYSQDITTKSITFNVDFNELGKIAGAELNFSKATPLTAAAHCNRYIWSSADLLCDLYLGSPMSTLVGDKLYESMETVKTGNILETLQASVEFPDIRALVNAGALNLSDVLIIRKKARKFRQWLQQESERDRDAIIAYHNEIGKELGVISGARKALTIFGILGAGTAGWAVGSALDGPVGGALGGLSGSGITYLTDIASKLGSNWKPVVFGNWLDNRINKQISEKTKSSVGANIKDHSTSLQSSCKETNCVEFNEPYKVYTAASNTEAHLIVVMLKTNDIGAYAEEDQSGVSLFSFGTISQFHQPNVWVEKSTAQAAAELIDQFFEKEHDRIDSSTNASPIDVECEECGKVSSFPGSQNGTTQDCSHCSAYVDVGELDWDENFGEAE